MTVLHCIDAIDRGFPSVTDKKRYGPVPIFSVSSLGSTPGRPRVSRVSGGVLLSLTMSTLPVGREGMPCLVQSGGEADPQRS
jgi:hypothetical protein